MKRPSEWIRIKTDDGNHVRIRCAMIEMYGRSQHGGTYVLLTGGQQVNIDGDVTKALDEAFAFGTWEDIGVVQ